MTRIAALWVVGLLAAGGEAAAKTSPPPARPAAAAPGPPDPRQGERLDGRSEYRDPYRYALVLPRALLLLPRVAAYAVLAPATAATEFVEENHLWTRAKHVLTSDDGKIGVRPIGYYETGFLPAVGLRWFDRRTLGEGTRLGASFQTAGPDLVEVTASIRPWRPPLELEGEFIRDPNAVFGGTDGLTRDELHEAGRNVSRYSFDRLAAALVWDDDATERLSYTLALAVAHVDYANGDARGGDSEIVNAFCADPGTPSCMSVDEELVPGFNEGLRNVSLNAAAAWDSRGHERYATGAMLLLTGRVAQGFGEDESLLAGGSATLCASRAVGERKFELCGRAGLVESLNDEPVPFEELMTPGGKDGVRAISHGRLRGQSELVGSIEYRWLLGTWFDAGLFLDAGGAFGPRFEDVTLDRFIPGVGVGFRYLRHDDRSYYWRAIPVAGVQFAWAPEEGFRLLFAVTR